MSGPHEGAAAPRIIGNRYALLAELGRGAMGVVWRAHDNLINRKVAIKELHLPEGLPPQEVQVLQQRVLREARTAGALNDPAVVTVFDVIVENGVTYIVMELVEGQPLDTLVKRNGPMPAEHVAGIGLRVLSALQAAHGAGIVHRDVKPGNILVCPDGQVKLTDFGIAQAVDDPGLTLNNAIIGSPAYLSPERVRGEAATPASDLWAFGATLAYAVEGSAPFQRTSTASTLHAIMNETPQLRLAHGSVAAAIAGLLAADPRARLTATQAAALLSGNATRPVAVAAGPTAGAGQVARQPAPAKRAPALVAAGVVALLLATGAFFAGRALSDSTEAAGSTPTGNGSDAPRTELDVTFYSFGRQGDIPVWAMGQQGCGTNLITKGAAFDWQQNVDCSQPHKIERYAAETPFYDRAEKGLAVPYPGQEWFRDYALHYCDLHARTVRVSADERDAFVFYALAPTKEEWEYKDGEAVGAKEVVCVLAGKDGADRTGSARG
ncbi:serine/threonine-protein kinase [Actinosynnema sp.]|uniref:serine/threonine-protein kinase n=1 Tax=Actinosynnema sp. TaxID=1872144 RepID=UPI003F86002B